MKKMVNIIRKFFYTNARKNYKNVGISKNNVSEGIDTTKTSLLKECMLYHN